MPTYVSLVNWTDQGAKNAKDTVARLDRGVEAAGKYGVQPRRTYWTVGPYDMVFVAEAPDAESMSAYLLEVGTAGNIRTLTLRAYAREEMSGIVGRLS